MKFQSIAAALALGAAALPASAAAISPCDADKAADNQCRVAIDYGKTAEIGPGVNPLYGISLRNVDVGHPSRAQRESLRRLLEGARRAAESDRKSAWRAFEAGTLDDAGLKDANKRYDTALVNYFLGVNAMRVEKAGE